MPPVAHRVPNTYGHSMDDIDKMCDGHYWYTIKITNIQNNFGLSFQGSTYASHLQCHNDCCNYIHHNRGVRNNTEWAGSTPLPLVVRNVAPTRSTITCKVCRSIHVCIALYYVRIIYIHFIFIEMSKACTHLGVHDHHVANDTCHELLDMAYPCIANKRLKTPTTKNSAIVMTTNKNFMVNYLLKSLASGEGHHLVGLSLEVVTDKFNILASPNYRNFVFGSKRFLRGGKRTMDNIIAHKDHSTFKFIHDSRFPRQSKDKMYVFNIYVDLSGGGVELVKKMQVGENMENS